MQTVPNANDLAQMLKGFAYCDALLMPDWDARYFSFDANWNPLVSEMMGSINDGQGMEIFFLFSRYGAAGKIFDGIISRDRKQLLHLVPEKFESFKSEAAFNLKKTTFLMWTENLNGSWNFLPHNSRLPNIFLVFSQGFEAYHSWAESYYGKSIDASALYTAYKNLEWNTEICRQLECETSTEEIQKELKIITG